MVERGYILPVWKNISVVPSRKRKLFNYSVMQKKKKAAKQRTVINSHGLMPVGVWCLVYNSMPYISV